MSIPLLDPNDASGLLQYDPAGVVMLSQAQSPDLLDKLESFGDDLLYYVKLAKKTIADNRRRQQQQQLLQQQHHQQQHQQQQQFQMQQQQIQQQQLLQAQLQRQVQQQQAEQLLLQQQQMQQQQQQQEEEVRPYVAHSGDTTTGSEEPPSNIDDTNRISPPDTIGSGESVVHESGDRNTEDHSMEQQQDGGAEPSGADGSGEEEGEAAEDNSGEEEGETLEDDGMGGPLPPENSSDDDEPVPKRRCFNDSRILPEDYIPGETTVVIGRGKKIKDREGHQRLCAIVKDNLRAYSIAGNKNKKSNILVKIVHQVQDTNPDHVGFVKWDSSTERWSEASMLAARTYVAQAFRDYNHTCYRSSKQSKKKKRKLKKMVARSPAPTTQSVLAARAQQNAASMELQPMSSREPPTAGSVLLLDAYRERVAALSSLVMQRTALMPTQGTQSCPPRDKIDP